MRHCRLLPLSFRARTPLPVAGRWALALSFLLGVAGVAAAQDQTHPDAVTDLRQALRSDRKPLVNADQTLEFPLEHRKKELDERIKKITNLGDMARGLLLQDWRLEPLDPKPVLDVDEGAWDNLARRFGTTVRAGLKQRNPQVQVAVCNLISDTTVTARDSATLQAVKVRRNISRLDDDLIALVQDRSQAPMTHEAAARALGLINPTNMQGAANALKQLLQTGTPPEREAAAQALGNLINVLAQRETKIQGPGVRLENLEQLIRRTCEAVGPAAVLGLSDPIPAVRRLAVDAIDQAALAIFDLIVVPGPRAMRFPPPGRTPTPEEVRDMQAYKDSVEADLRDFYKVAQAFRGAIDPAPGSGQRGLAQISATDPDPGIRLRARQTLEDLNKVWGRMREKLATVPTDIPAAAPKPSEDLQARLHPHRTRLPQGLLMVQAGPARTQTPEQELQAGLRQELSALVVGLRDRNAALRLAAVEALEALGDVATSVVPDLACSLDDPDRFVRWAAVRTLAKLAPAAPDAVVPGLARNLFYPDVDVQTAAALALERYGPAAAAAVPTLGRLVNPTDFEIRSGRSDVEVRVPALYALESIGEKDVRPVLPAITTALGSGAADVRRTAAEILARFGPAAKSSAPALQPLLSDPDDQVRRAASDALLAVEAPEK